MCGEWEARCVKGQLEGENGAVSCLIIMVEQNAAKQLPSGWPGDGGPVLRACPPWHTHSGQLLSLLVLWKPTDRPLSLGLQPISRLSCHPVLGPCLTLCLCGHEPLVAGGAAG